MTVLETSTTPITSDGDFLVSSKVTTDSFFDFVIFNIFKTASRLTDPVCKAHEFWCRIYLVDALEQNRLRVTRVAKKFLLLLGVAICTFAAIFTTLPGLFLRYLASRLQNKPYLHLHTETKGKMLASDRSFTCLFWNICGLCAGYSIFEGGGVSPWHYRIDGIVDKIVQKNADVNCLYEVFDFKFATLICDKLKDRGYCHFYFNIGPRAVGLCSGIMVASKFAISNPEFVPFPASTLVGNTTFVSKGVFAFDLQSAGKRFIRMFATHLQHSKVPEKPSKEEVVARRRQMELIISKIKEVQDRKAVLGGDLNLDSEEYQRSFWSFIFRKNDDFRGAMTWDGEEFSTRFLGRPPSLPRNLDHVMILKSGLRKLRTTLLETGFNPFSYNEKALSDHKGLMSEISI